MSASDSNVLHGCARVCAHVGHLHEWFSHLLPTLIISYQGDEQQVTVFCQDPKVLLKVQNKQPGNCVFSPLITF